MQIVTLQDARLLDWAAERLQIRFDPAMCRWVAGLDAGGIVWVVVYQGFSERSCSLTIATDGSKRWASRRSLHEIFKIPFRQWNLSRVTFTVRADNHKSLKMMQKGGRSPLGVVHEGKLRDFFGEGVDALVFGMLKRECKWMR